MPYYLGIDAGTTKIAAVVVDTATGRTVRTNELPNESETTSAADRAHGRSEWDAERAAQLTFECIRQTLSGVQPGEVRGVGVTGQMHGVVIVNRQGKPVSPFIGWQDQRCQTMLPTGDVNYIGRMMQLAGVGGFARTGCPPATGYMGSSLFWLAANGDSRLTKAGKSAEPVTACFLPDYIVMRLTGKGPVTDPTNAGGSGVFNVSTGQWNLKLIDRLGLKAEVFPQVMKSCSIAGGLTPEAARNVGLRDGAPVAVGCGDNQASFAGSVADSSASVLVNIGTGAQVSAWVPTYLAVQTVDTRPHLDGGFLLVGAPLCGGLSYALLRIFFDMVGKQIFRLGEEEDFYDTMTALAASAPSGADGLRCEPLFTGTRLEPDRRAAFSGITPANFTPGHFARAVLEGIAEQVHLHYADMLEAGIKPRTQLVCSGNGVRRNALLAAILCKTFGMPMRLTATQEEAAFGAALVAAVGIGEFPDLRTACRLVQYHS